MAFSPRTVMQFIASLALLSAQPLYAQEGGSAVVFALIDKNEWCPGGSVYVDLDTGSFMLSPRLQRFACENPKARSRIERGTLSQKQLLELRSAYSEARQAGLGRKSCELVISNGGPEALIINGPAFSAATPQNEGCRSEEAKALHGKLFRMFGEKRQSHM